MISSSSEGHPSYLALDRASLGLGDAQVREHLEVCAECRAHVESVGRSATESEWGEAERRLRQRQSQRWLWLGAAPVAAAAIALLYLGVKPQLGMPNQPVYVGDKGFSSVWIYVKHGASTALWDGNKPIFVGDRLRLKVDPGRFKWVEVYSVKTPSLPELLYSGSLTPSQSMTLPDAWEIDAEPGDERLLVVFSNAKVVPHWPDWLRGKAQPGVMLLPFVLPKSGAPDASPGSTSP